MTLPWTSPKKVFSLRTLLDSPMRREFRFKPIGFIRSPYKRVEEVPRDCSSTLGEVVVEEYEEGLRDIEGFSHLVILWVFHRSRGGSLVVKPLHYEGLKGVFATRHPDRPNPIALTIVELIERRGNTLRVRGVDASPLLDIKPYTHRDRVKRLRAGWIDEVGDHPYGLRREDPRGTW
ncbi:MAG: S-adenosyl-L-methionine-binding protein [Candidatus Bathyarchaeota archaeon B23]|nr:MAG: S-adenosyl-L-methionine-binding protein [Candidatus Bathyarchaeota archaeon B23]